MLMSSTFSGHISHRDVTDVPECDLSQAFIEYCKTEITSTWDITQNTVLNQVDIVCSTTTKIDCINLTKGVSLDMVSVMITSNNIGRCIRMQESSTLLALLLATDLIAANCGGSTSDSGGLLYGHSGSGSIAVSLIDSRIHDCQGSGGGAICLFNGNLTLDNTSIMGSKSHGFDGGAIVLVGGGTHMFNKTKLQYNTADRDGGAILLDGGGELTLVDTVIEHNTAARYGGAIYFYTSTTYNKAVLHLLSGNSIAHNRENDPSLYYLCS